jgi:hypothetical protein
LPRSPRRRRRLHASPAHTFSCLSIFLYLSRASARARARALLLSLALSLSLSRARSLPLTQLVAVSVYLSRALVRILLLILILLILILLIILIPTLFPSLPLSLPRRFPAGIGKAEKIRRIRCGVGGGGSEGVPLELASIMMNGRRRVINDKLKMSSVPGARNVGATLTPKPQPPNPKPQARTPGKGLLHGLARDGEREVLHGRLHRQPCQSQHPVLVAVLCRSDTGMAEN